MSDCSSGASAPERGRLPGLEVLRRYLVIPTAPVLFAVLFAGCSSDQSTSPTEPEPVPAVDVAGRWEGSWTPGTDVDVQMVLRQTGTVVDGAITLLDTSLSIRGRVEDPQDADPSLSWNATNAGCGTFSGRLQVSGNTLTGPATLDTQGCEEPGRYHGDMRLDRVGSATGASGPPTGSLHDLSRRLGPLRPNHRPR